jgi:hypothetical protein
MIPILSGINPIPSIDTYLFKVHSNFVGLGLPKGLFPVDIEQVHTLDKYFRYFESPSLIRVQIGHYYLQPALNPKFML